MTAPNPNEQDHSNVPQHEGNDDDHTRDRHHHGHHHGPVDYGRAFAIGVTLNVALVVVQAAYGVLANSVAFCPMRPTT